MAEQVSTPGSAADSSVAGTSTKPSLSAPKDKACPFCGQPFTSSSLGRHLDLYIKEKNPKPADGLHDVDEIRKMRGAITRRQPRNSSGRREGSTPGGTPALSAGPGAGNETPSGTPTRSSSAMTRQPMITEKGRIVSNLNAVNWQSTGVINNIPAVHQRNDLNGTVSSGGETVNDSHNKRFVSRQVLAKSTFDQKQKMLDAMEGQRAAELALREILGSIKAAITIAQPSINSSPFDFDPLALDFPGLCLTCLPPPPTIGQMTPIQNPNCWFTDVPDQRQFEALGVYFREHFHAGSVTRTVISSTPPHPDDILYAHHAAPDVQATIAHQAKLFEENVNNHLHEAYKYWMRLPQQNREHLWKLELARFVGLKQMKIQQMEGVLETVQQENAHLRHQIESLSKLQNPREFAMAPPQTLPLGKRDAVALAELGMKGQSRGFKLAEKEESLQKRVEAAVERWKPVVRSSRGVGMPGQRTFGQGMQVAPGMNSPVIGMNGMQQQQQQQQGHQQMGDMGEPMNSAGMDIDAEGEADADGDADGDEEARPSVQQNVAQQNFGMQSQGPPQSQPQHQSQHQSQNQVQQQQNQRTNEQAAVVNQHMIAAGYPNISQQQHGMAMLNLQQQHNLNQGVGGVGHGDMNGINTQGGLSGQQAQAQMAALRRQQAQAQQAQQAQGQAMAGRAGGRINVSF